MTTLTLTRSVTDLGIVRMLTHIGHVFASIAAAQQATAEFERMNARTDAQLAAQGLQRSDVSRVVFERHFN